MLPISLEFLLQQIAELSAKLKWYKEQFRLAQQKRFGASSEKTHPDQMDMELFNEAEVLAASAPQEPDVETVIYSRKKTLGNREAKLDQFLIETIHYELSADLCVPPLQREEIRTPIVTASMPKPIQPAGPTHAASSTKP